jgi:hypothetical protein
VPELLIVVLAVLGLIALVALPAPWAIYGGVALTWVSLVAGITAGAVYHVILARALRSGPGDARPAGWWWHPTRHHSAVPESRRPAMLRWFHAGAAGFVGCIAGAAMFITGVLRAW